MSEFTGYRSSSRSNRVAGWPHHANRTGPFFSLSTAICGAATAETSTRSTSIVHGSGDPGLTNLDELNLAGVKLRRAFGFGETADYDPFLLFDDFRNDNSGDYLAGFPWHPHRGMETITYVLAGSVRVTMSDSGDRCHEHSRAAS